MGGVGVGENGELRARLTQAATLQGVRVFYPAPEFCTDNGAMIAFAAAKRLEHSSLIAHHSSPKRSFDVRPRWDLSTLKPINA